MKLKEILDFLNENKKNVTLNDLLEALDNIGYEGADENTDINKDLLKKFSKFFGIEIKPAKPVKPTKQVQQKPVKEETKEEKTVVAEEVVKAKPEVMVEKKKEEPKPITPKLEDVSNNKEKEKEEKKEVKETPKPKELETPKKQEKKQEKQEPKQEEIKLNHVYDDVYGEYEKKEKTYSRLKNVHKKNNIIFQFFLLIIALTFFIFVIFLMYIL